MQSPNVAGYDLERAHPSTPWSLFRLDSRQLWSEVLAWIYKLILFKVILPVVEFAVSPAKLEQLVVAATLDDLTRLENQDLVSAADGGEPVSDDKRGSTAAQRAKSPLNLRLTLAVKA
jgi:hypothetical protein